MRSVTRSTWRASPVDMPPAVDGRDPLRDLVHAHLSAVSLAEIGGEAAWRHSAVVRARKAAVFTRFWQAVEQ